MLNAPNLNLVPVTEHEEIEQLRRHAVFGPLLLRAEEIAHGSPTQESTPNQEVMQEQSKNFLPKIKTLI